MIPGHDGFRCWCGATFTSSGKAMDHLLVHALIGDEMEYKGAIDMLYHTHCCIVNDEAVYSTKDKRTLNIYLTQFEADILVDAILTKNGR